MGLFDHRRSPEAKAVVREEKGAREAKEAKVLLQQGVPQILPTASPSVSPTTMSPCVASRSSAVTFMSVGFALAGTHSTSATVRHPVKPKGLVREQSDYWLIQCRLILHQALDQQQAS